MTKKIMGFRLLKYHVLLVIFLLGQTGTIVKALPLDQKKVFGKQILYFNVESCSTSPSTNTNPNVGSNIYIIGDSLTEGMRDSGNLEDKLSKAGWTITGIEATTGITIDASTPKIRANKDDVVSKADTIVVGLGTNTSPNPKAKIQEMINAIHSKNSDAQIFWVNAYSTKTSYSSFNTILDGFKADGKIDKIINWAEEARNNPSKYDLSRDSLGIHPQSVNGYPQRSTWLVDKIGTPSTSPGGSGGGNVSSSSSETLNADQKISRTFMVGFSAKTPKDTIKDVVKKYKIGGIFILGTNDAAAAGFTKDFFDELDKLAGHKLIISSDEEGVFTRYKYSFNFPNASEMGRMSDSDVTDIGKKVGNFLAEKGVNTDLAPVLDVAKDSSNSTAGTSNRTFSDDPDIVTKKASAFAKGLKSAGVNSVYKHFPGLGSSNGNTDTSSVTSPSLSELKKKDLKPYEAISNKNGAAVMMDNAHIPGLTKPGDVASTSSEAVDLLTGDYKFKGLIMTDDLGAAGVPTSLPSSITKSLKAGVDMPLFAYRDTATLDSAISSARNLGVGTKNHIQKIEDFARDTTISPDNSGSNQVGDVCCTTQDGSGPGFTLSGNGIGEKVFNFFVSEMGFNNSQAAAATGNLQLESANFTVIDGWGGGGGNYYGLAQWDRNIRYRNLVEFSHGEANAAKLENQLAFVKHELEGDYKTSSLDPLLKATTLEDMVYIWVRYYEGAVDSSQEKGVQMYQERLNYATTWKNNADGGAGSETPGTTVSASDNPGASCTSSSNRPGSVDGYQDPFRDIKNLGPSRIDQGVDYTGSGPIYPIGNSIIVTANSGSGWPGGTFIAYKLKDGPAAGKYVFFAENCKPIKVKVGDEVTTSDELCTMIDASPHIEIGWAEPPGTGYAAAYNCIGADHNNGSAYGLNMSELLHKLGAPAGIQYGHKTCASEFEADNYPSWE